MGLIESPLVSVLLPAYKAGRFLDDAIKSVLDQSYTNLELIIVDNNSDDNTDEVVSKYKSDVRVKYYKNRYNIGMVGNWNKCLSFAKGKYIKYLMADDRFDPDLLHEFVAVMETNPSVSLVTSYKGMFSDDFTGELTLKPLPLSGFHKGGDIIRHTLNSNGWIGEPTLVMFRGENLRLGAFNQKYTWLPDWEMWLRHLSVGDCYIIPKPLAHIRVHTGQVTTTVMKNAINYFEEYQLCLDLREGKLPDLGLNDRELKKIIKRRAGNFILALFRQFKYVKDKKHRTIFLKAFRIVQREQVFLSGSWQATKAFASQVNERFRNMLSIN